MALHILSKIILDHSGSGRPTEKVESRILVNLTEEVDKANLQYKGTVLHIIDGSHAEGEHTFTLDANVGNYNATEVTQEYLDNLRTRNQEIQKEMEANESLIKAILAPNS